MRKTIQVRGVTAARAAEIRAAGRDIAEIAPDPDGWNVWRWRDPDDGSTAYCVGNAASATEARTLAMRLGAHQIQHGLDGDVEGT